MTSTLAVHCCSRKAKVRCDWEPLLPWTQGWTHRDDSLRSRWVGLLLAMALLTTGCASLPPPPGREMNLGFTPHGAAAPTLAEEPNVESPLPLVSPPPSLPEPEVPERLHRRRGSRETMMGAGPGRAAGAVGGVVPRGAGGTGMRSATLVHQAVLDAVGDVSGSTRRIADSLSRLAANKAGISGRANGVFNCYVVYGAQQLQWIDAALAGATRLANVASQVDDPDMELAILRLTGPRIEAAMSGSLLLAAWLDFLNLAEVVLRQCPFYSVEKLLVDMERVQRMLEPSMTALSSLERVQIEVTASALPPLMGQLTSEFDSTREAVRLATERGGQLMMAAQLVEMLSLTSTMKMSLPRLPPAAPAALGVGLMVGADGVMMGTRIVVSAEWVEMMRRLVQAGVISLPVVGAAVRIHAGQVMMSQSNQDLPQGVRDALGDGPEVRGMRVTGRAGAGMAEPPQHHVLPREHRKWFEKRGFTGEMSIDQFCVKMEQARHEAIHGGGDWRLGRMWPGEWNRMIMNVLRDAETEAGRMLTRNEILRLVTRYMKEYDIPVNFSPWRRK